MSAYLLILFEMRMWRNTALWMPEQIRLHCTGLCDRLLTHYFDVRELYLPLKSACGKFQCNWIISVRNFNVCWRQIYEGSYLFSSVWTAPKFRFRHIAPKRSKANIPPIWLAEFWVVCLNLCMDHIRASSKDSIFTITKEPLPARLVLNS